MMLTLLFAARNVQQFWESFLPGFLIPIGKSNMPESCCSSEAL